MQKVRLGKAICPSEGGKERGEGGRGGKSLIYRIRRESIRKSRRWVNLLERSAHSS